MGYGVTDGTLTMDELSGRQASGGCRRPSVAHSSSFGDIPHRAFSSNQVPRDRRSSLHFDHAILEAVDERRARWGLDRENHRHSTRPQTVRHHLPYVLRHVAGWTGI